MNIGVFDSGVGGLWILKHLQNKLPQYNYIFFGDQNHAPYGERSMEEIRSFSEEITKFLIKKGCSIVVVACNTASAAALKYLRVEFPDVIFIGMEPAVKKAIEITSTKKVLVLATPATFQGELYGSLVERFASDVEIYKEVPEGLVREIEQGHTESKETIGILGRAIKPNIEKGIDTVVLGCTHYPFVIDQIQKISGEKVNIIDPTNAIVRRVESILIENNLATESDDNNHMGIYTSGDIASMDAIASKLFKSNLNIMKLEWNNKQELNVVE